MTLIHFLYILAAVWGLSVVGMAVAVYRARHDFLETFRSGWERAAVAAVLVLFAPACLLAAFVGWWTDWGVWR